MRRRWGHAGGSRGWRPKIRRLPKVILWLFAGALLFAAGSAAAGAEPEHGQELLLDSYHRNKARLESSSFGLPLFLDSFEQGDRVHVDVCGIFAYPFDRVVAMLEVPANWCDIVALHPNVKACTYQEQPDDWMLTFYLGRKVYQRPEEARPVVFRYRNADRQQGYLDVALTADSGPFGTRDHRMRFEALPLDESRTLVRVSYAYLDSAALRLAAKIYFATLGRSKVGFTVTGTDSDGNPVHIGGPRGSIERNAVRYYFAIQTFMNTLRYPEADRFGMRISEWYDLTDRYRRQLFELSKEDYLAFKAREHANQVTLQRRIGMPP